MKNNSTRQIMLDTETTGISVQQGNRISLLLSQHYSDDGSIQ